MKTSALERGGMRGRGGSGRHFSRPAQNLP